MNTEIKFLGKLFSTPLVGSSGTIGYGYDFKELISLKHFGGLTFKSLTPKPRKGNPFPRVCETEYGLINSIGIQNTGLNDFIKNTYPQKITSLKEVIKIVSLAAFTIEDFVTSVKKVSLLKEIDFIELNVSCPNIDYHNKDFASDKKLLQELIKSCKKIKAQKIIVKLSPQFQPISKMGEICQKAGADALSIANTFKAMKINIQDKKPFIHNIIGGYSGPAIKPMVLAMVYETAQKVTLPIIGIGGVTSGEDVVEYLLAGATLVGIGTTNLINPKRGKKIFKEFQHYLKRNKTSTKELSGAMLTY